MEHLPWNGSKQIICHAFSSLTTAVDRITHNRMFDGGTVDSDLVSSPGFEIKLNQGGLGKPFSDSPGGFGHATFSAMCGHFFSIHRMPSDGKCHPARIRFHSAVNKGQILFFNASRFKLQGQVLMCCPMPLQ